MLDQGAPAGLRPFTCKFPYKVALAVKSQCISTAARTKRGVWSWSAAF